jgi:pantoate--beta-alanine ligase
LLHILTKDIWGEIWLQAIKTDKKIGFVPTMGALHSGHFELIRASKSRCDLTVVSVFVNPTQFSKSADFKNYPNTLVADLELLRQEKVDVIYTPSVEEIYGESPEIHLSFGDLETNLEGSFRPGHFNGVGTVVSKLFNIIRPHVSFFGQKDLQQVAIIKRLVQALSFQLDLVIVPTKREADGLAMSSRNLMLSATERAASIIIFASLCKAKKELIEGKVWFEVRKEIVGIFEANQFSKLEYLELINPDTFDIQADLSHNLKSAICLAAYLGEIRLIDNISINP